MRKQWLLTEGWIFELTDFKMQWLNRMSETGTSELNQSGEFLLIELIPNLIGLIWNNWYLRDKAIIPVI